MTDPPAPEDFRATYRLQLGADLDFARARELVPYLAQLGISHLYLSPIWQARGGSTHGYDVVDPTRISEELGGEEEFRELAASGLGIVVDIVPNHMAASEQENLFWRDPLLRAKFFDLDWRTGVNRRFFDIDDLAGVRMDDPEVFEALSRKVVELVGDGVVDGVRVDHLDGLAYPARYIRRLREAGIDHVWVEKILAPDELLRDWPVEGTTGYEFLNDVTALFVNPDAEEPFTKLYQAVTGEHRSAVEIAIEAKVEQADTTFDREVEWLEARLGPLADATDLPVALGAFHVYRTYVDPDLGQVEALDRQAVAAAALPDTLAEILLLEKRGYDAFLTRFQQVTPAVAAKGVEDTAHYRYNRLLALNEVGGDPDRWSIGPADFFDREIERARRFPRQLLATQTHDTKRSGDVRARIAALTWLVDDWRELVQRIRFPPGIDPNDAYHVLQTLAGAWPLSRARLDAYVEKALRECKLRSSWLEPDLEYENAVKAFAWSLGPTVEPLLDRLQPIANTIVLAQTLLKTTCPGVPDVYQGDEFGCLNLVDPDNRRPVDWALRLTPSTDPPPKTRVIRQALALRARFPEAFAGSYEPIQLGPDLLAFTIGSQLMTLVPLRPHTRCVPPTGWRDLFAGELPVALCENTTSRDRTLSKAGR